MQVLSHDVLKVEALKLKLQYNKGLRDSRNGRFRDRYVKILAKTNGRYGPLYGCLSKTGSVT